LKVGQKALCGGHSTQDSNNQGGEKIRGSVIHGRENKKRSLGEGFERRWKVEGRIKVSNGPMMRGHKTEKKKGKERAQDPDGHKRRFQKNLRLGIKTKPGKKRDLN